MTGAAFVAASAQLTPALLVLAAVTGAGLLAWSSALPRRQGTGAGDFALSPTREALLLLVILAVALLMRTAGARAGLTAPFWFAEAEPLVIGKILREGTLWHDWLRSWRNVQVVWLHDSPLTLPVAAGAQALLGASFHLPLLIGAFYGVGAVVLAWALGRAAHSPVFGLAFAAFVAASPLELAWSRLGGLYIGCVPQVLLALWCGYQAGRRGSLLLALTASLVAWTSLYYYYAARVGIPLGLLALVAGARDARLGARRLLGLGLVWLVALAAVYVALHPATLKATFWPGYLGYTGNKGETSLREVLAQNALPVAREARRVLERYFLYDRAAHEARTHWFRWAVTSGGLCLAPVAVLGLVGLTSFARRPARGWLWLAVAAAGFAVPALSVSTSRRFLVFDLGWCALAAGGLLAVLRSRLGRALRPAAVRGSAVAVPLVLAGWSFATILALNAVLPRGHSQPIPFAEAGFFDGLTCLRCLDAARDWQRDITADAFIVLVDSDRMRENPTIPGGLPLYGKLAALSAGRPDHFAELYSVMSNHDAMPPRRGPYFAQASTDFAAYLSARIESAGPARILWHFERPTQWERWLAERLVEVGGEQTTFETPLSATPGLQVRTPWSDRHRAFKLLRMLGASGADEHDRCPALARVARATYPTFTPLALAAPPDADVSQPREWLVASWFTARHRDTTLDTLTPSGAAVESRDALPARFHLLTRSGTPLTFEGPLQTRSSPSMQTGGELGVGCAALIGEHWWIVDPATGALHTTDAWGRTLPPEPWAGVTRGPGGEVVLAAADQWIAVLDAASGSERRRFPAVVGPSWGTTTGECSAVLAGDSWYGTFSKATSVLSVYDREGDFVGHRRLDRLLGLGGHHILSIGASGRWLAVGYHDVVETLALEIGPECAHGH